jgi:hypothetical protein
MRRTPLLKKARTAVHSLKVGVADVMVSIGGGFPVNKLIRFE